MRRKSSHCRGRSLRLEALEDKRLLTDFLISSGADDGPGTLRQALSVANFNGEHDNILFESDLGTIFLNSPLVAIEPINIDGVFSNVTLAKSSSFSGRNTGIILAPELSGGGTAFSFGSTFQVKNLAIDGDWAGITVDEVSGTPTATAESVTISNNTFTIDAPAGGIAAGVHFDGSVLSPFKIESNTIIGPGLQDSTSSIAAGIILEEATSFTNSSMSIIKDNDIAAFDEAGIFIDKARIPNLEITGGSIGIAQIPGQNAKFGIGIGIAVAADASLSTPQKQVDLIDTTILNYTNFGIELAGTDNATITDTFITDSSISSGSVGAAIFVHASIDGNDQNYAQNNVIENNTFEDNSSLGVAVGFSVSAPLDVGNRIEGNTFTRQGGLPIDLGGNGIIELNDQDDEDDGPNGLQNHVETGSTTPVYTGSGWEVPITFDARATGSYTFDFFRIANGSPASYTYQESQVLPVTAQSQSTTDLSTTVTLSEINGWQAGFGVGVVVTDASGNSSELVEIATELTSDTVAPKVTNLKISDGGIGGYDLSQVLTGAQSGGEQVKTVPVGNIDTFEITFSEPVEEGPLENQLQASDFGILGLKTGDRPTYVPGSFIYNPATRTAKWEFTGVVADEHYLLFLKDTITDAAGNRLDGEWINPSSLSNAPPASQVSNFAAGNGSGDGSPEGNFGFVMNTVRLTGDADNDGSVAGSDLLAVTNNFGSVGPADGLLIGDADDDGAVAGSDLLAVTNHFGDVLGDIVLLLDLNNNDEIDFLDFFLYDITPVDLDGDGDTSMDPDDLAIRNAYEAFFNEFGAFEVELA